MKTRALTTAAIVSVLALGGVSALLTHRTPRGYVVIVAGGNVTDEDAYSTLVDAEQAARMLYACPEDEADKGRALLILDQDHRLIDTIGGHGR